MHRLAQSAAVFLMAVIIVGIALLRADSQATAQISPTGQSAVSLPLILKGSDQVTAQPTATPPTTTPGQSLEEIQAEVVRLVNIERVKGGCSEGIANADLMRGAQAWSQYMADNNYFQHSSTVDVYWYRKHNYLEPHFSPRENVAGGAITPAEVVQAWMNSPPHRGTILDCRYDSLGALYEYGVGYAGARWTLAIGYVDPAVLTPTPTTITLRTDAIQP